MTTVCADAAWSAGTAEYAAYHDKEWGRPVVDDAKLFEKLCLEGFQAGLSWLTILRKRANFRRAFHGFDFERVARYGERDVQRLLADAGIVRQRAKIEAAIANARATISVRDACGSLAALMWAHEPTRRGRPVPKTFGEIPAVTEESTALARRPEALRLPVHRAHHRLRGDAVARARERPRARVPRPPRLRQGAPSARSDDQSAS